MNQYNFVKFTKTGSKLGNYSIGLTKSQTFGFNSGFYNREGIKNYKKVVLFYDKKQKSVAFQFINDERAEGAYTLIHINGAGSVTPRSFIAENDLDKDEYRGQRTPEKVRDPQFGTLYVIQLMQSKNAQ